MIATDTKVCKDCGQELPLDAFYRDKKCSQGRKPRCKRCFEARRDTPEFIERRRARQRKYQRSPKGRATNNAWQRGEKRKAYMRAYKKTEKYRGRMRLWTNTPSGRESNRKSQRKYKAKIRVRARKLLDLYEENEPRTIEEEQLALRALRARAERERKASRER